MREVEFPYLGGYPENLLAEVRAKLREGELLSILRSRYPNTPEVRTDGALYEYVMALKNEFLRRSSPLSKICFDDKIGTLHGALGLHSYVSRVQGGRTKAKNELRVASQFKEFPPEFLRMVVVHELAHLREKEHNKAFYQLCLHIEPSYHTYEFDLRLYLTALDHEALIRKRGTSD